MASKGKHRENLLHLAAVGRELMVLPWARPLYKQTCKNIRSMRQVRTGELRAQRRKQEDDEKQHKENPQRQSESAAQRIRIQEQSQRPAPAPCVWACPAASRWRAPFGATHRPIAAPPPLAGCPRHLRPPAAVALGPCSGHAPPGMLHISSGGVLACSCKPIQYALSLCWHWHISGRAER